MPDLLGTGKTHKLTKRFVTPGEPESRVRAALYASRP